MLIQGSPVSCLLPPAQKVKALEVGETQAGFLGRKTAWKEGSL